MKSVIGFATRDGSSFPWKHIPRVKCEKTAL